jgi:hypothetical protein
MYGADGRNILGDMPPSEFDAATTVMDDIIHDGSEATSNTINLEEDEK